MHRMEISTNAWLAAHLNITATTVVNSFQIGNSKAWNTWPLLIHCMLKQHPFLCALSLSLPAISLWIFLLNSTLAYHETCMALLTGKLSPSCFSGFETHSLHLIATLFPESRALAWTHLGAHLPTSCAQAQLEKKKHWAILTSSNQNNNISSNISFPFNFQEIWEILPKIPSIFQKSGSLTPPDSPPPCCYTCSVHFHWEKTPFPPKEKLRSQGDSDHGQPNGTTTQGCDSGGIVRTLSLVEVVSHAGGVRWSRTLELGWLHKRIGENKTVVICKC